MSTTTIESSDVVRLMLQFCKENGLSSTFDCLQRESLVSMNTVQNVDSFLVDVRQGNWERVLTQCQDLELPGLLMMNLYEQITLEMAESQEIQVVQDMLKYSKPLQTMKHQSPERFRRLERCIKRFDPNVAYAGKTRDAARDKIASELKLEISAVSPSRLVTLLGQALQWQQLQEKDFDVGTFDIFRGRVKAENIDYEDRFPKTTAGKIKFGKKSLPQVAVFSPTGKFFVSGSMDGFLEVWDYETGKLRTDLLYQQNDKFMMHEKAITSICFTNNAASDVMASGCASGVIKLWKTSDGMLLKRLDNAHSKSVYSIRFSSDCSKVLSASEDSLVRIHGLKSGHSLKEFRGHTASVNDATFVSEERQVISCSNDGTIRLWSVNTTENLRTFKLPHAVHGIDYEIFSVSELPSHATLALSADSDDNDSSSTYLLVCSRSNKISVLSSTTGKLVKEFEAPSGDKYGNFAACALSNSAKYLHALTETGRLLSYELKSGSIDNDLEVANKDVYGIVQHPKRNIVATVGIDACIRFWKA